MKPTNYLKTTLCLIATAALVGCASPGTTYTRSTGRAIDDSATTSRVKSAIGKDSLVKSTEIDVTTFRGNVHLTGFVDHPIQKDRASQIVRNVEGVEWFKNDILVKTELPNMKEVASEQQQIREPSGAEHRTGASSWEHGRGDIETETHVDKSTEKPAESPRK